MISIPPLESAIVVAIIGFIGAIAGALLNRATQRDAARISLLDVTIQNLTKRVENLEVALARAESDRDAARALAHEADSIRWHAISYARALLAWGRDLLTLIPEGSDIPSEPCPPPELDDKI